MKKESNVRTFLSPCQAPIRVGLWPFEDNPPREVEEPNGTEGATLMRDSPPPMSFRPAARLLQVLVALQAVMTAGPCIAQATSGERLEDTVREVMDVERAFARTMADRDLKAFSGFVAEDAVFRDGKKLLVGRNAVVEGWHDLFQPGPPPFSWEPDRVTVDKAGATAVSSGPVRGSTGEIVARFTTIWRKQVTAEGNARWQAIVDQGVPLIGCASSGK